MIIKIPLRYFYKLFSYNYVNYEILRVVMYKRTIYSILKEVLETSPAVLLTGARQVGKSTLALSLNRNYVVFDNLSQREAAYNDPIGYIDSLQKPVTIDEVQKVPQVLEGIKIYIDKHHKNGDFLLTGSANVLDMKLSKDTLAGRVIELRLFPLSAKELHNKADENFIDTIFKDGIKNLKVANLSTEDILQNILNGGYPQVQTIKSIRAKSLWFSSYISTYVERDIRDVGELRDITSFIKLFNIIAPRSCGLLNKAELSNEAGLSEVTVSNYLTMLEMIYQISFLRAYSSNISKRFIKSPKLYISDSGVLSHLLNITTTQELLNSNKKGEVIETFVYNELLKHIAYSDTMPQIFHYRTNDKKEIDFVIEKGDRIIAIEVKSSFTVKLEHFKHIIDFQKKSSKKIVGIVFYMGESILPFGDENYERYALPIGVLF